MKYFRAKFESMFVSVIVIRSMCQFVGCETKYKYVSLSVFVVFVFCHVRPKSHMIVDLQKLLLKVYFCKFSFSSER